MDSRKVTACRNQENRLELAQEEMLKVVQLCFPVGCLVWWPWGKSGMCHGEVFGHDSGHLAGGLKVRTDSGHAHSVHWSNVKMTS